MGQMPLGSLSAHFAALDDPRMDRTKHHALLDLIVIAVCTVICGADSWVAIEEFGVAKHAWLRQFLALPNGIPSHDTFGRVFAALDATAFQQGFLRWVQAVWPTDVGEVVARDGKTLRGTRRSGTVVQPAVHLLSLYDVTHQGTLAQVEVPTKEHEIPAASALIAGRDLRGCVVTADALHTQRQWCRTVRAQGGDYVLIAKKNQRSLREDIALLFAGAWPAWLEQCSATTVNKGHGRIEVRHIRASTELNAYLAAQWTDVGQVFQIERDVVRQGKATHELVGGLTSLPAASVGPEELLGLVRGHWALENRGHWRRDVTLGEDACQVKQGKAAQVLAALNNSVLMLMDRLGVPNVAAQMREFAANPLAAVALLFGPP